MRSSMPAMAVTVLGGLLSSTILNLVLLPACVEKLGGPGRQQDRD